MSKPVPVAVVEDVHSVLTRPPLRVDGRVLRFRSEDGYNDTFGLQWNRFRQAQLDHINGTDLSRQRVDVSGWDLSRLRGLRLLEAGSGAGRFTRIFAETGALVTTFDYSSAVNANVTNNGHYPTVEFAQADILDMPFAPKAFDLVFCHGVLQHTPDPARAFRELVARLRPGGRISIDIYRKDLSIRPWKSKRLWRWLTTRTEPARLLRFLEWFIPRWLPIDTRIKRIPKIGTYLGSIIPCWNYHDRPLSEEDKVTWAIMDTFDALAPKYDIPASMSQVQRWCRECGLVDVQVFPGGNGVVANGRMPI